MAVLADADRIEVWTKYMSDISNENEAFAALTKADIRAAVDALDVWLNDNAAAANTAIPQPARAQLTTPQKARLMNYVIRQRYIKGA